MKALLIGGGTGGHILPLVPLMREFKKKGVHIETVVADAPLDRALVKQSFPDIPVHFFRASKIRRYWSWKNILAPFSIIASIHRACAVLKDVKPDIIFFKGGFVGFPFLMATRIKYRKIALFSHESDISAGALTNLARKWCKQTFESFGTPPLPLYFSNAEKMRVKPPLEKNGKPKLLVLGGSLGAQWINESIEKGCHDICKNFDILLVSGRNKTIACDASNFTQKELLPAAELTNELEQADIVLSRAGANSLFEIIAAKKPSLIVPLPSAARNHQVKNAEWFAKQGLCNVLEQDSGKDLLSSLLNTLKDKELKKHLTACNIKNSAQEIVKIMLR